MSARSQRRRSLRSFRATAIGTLTAALLFTMVNNPISSAAEGSASASAGTATSSTVTIEAPSQNASKQGDIDAAKAKITEEQAATKVRELFPMLKDAQMSGSRLTDGRNSGQSDGSQLIWEISWTIQKGNGSHGFSSSVNAITGDLIQSGIPTDLLAEPSYYPPKMSKQQAEEVARKFIAKAAPSLGSPKLENSDLYKGMNMSPLFGPVEYSFSFQVFHEGVKVQGESINVVVNGNGNVTNYYSYNNSVEYPSSKPKLTHAEAKQKWEKDLTLQLAYFPVDYRWNRAPEKWSLAYGPGASLTMLDAQSGKWSDGITQIPESDKPVTYVELTAKGEAYKSHPVTAEEAIKSITAVADIPEEYKVESKQLNKGINGEHDTWHIRWTKDNNNGFYDGRSAQVDAQTGQLLHFYVDHYGGPMGLQEEAKPAKALPKDKAVQIADSWILGNIPSAASYKRVVSSAADENEQYGYTTVSYQMFYNDVMVQTLGINITLNGEGKIVSMNSQPAMESTAPLEKLEAKLTAEEAKAAILKATDMELVYVRSGGYTTMPSGKYIPVTTTLVYLPIDLENGQSFYRVIDAISGKFVNMYGNINGMPTAGEPSDIQGHKAHEALVAAIEHGVIIPDKEGKVNPNATITTGQFLKMVALAMNPNVDNSNYYYGEQVEKHFSDIDDKSPYYRSVNYLVGIGIMKGNSAEKLNPDTELTRDQLAEYLALITGYSKLSLHLAEDASVTGLKDAKSISNPGAVALAMKLKLMNATEGSFQPNGKITVADAAAVLLLLAQKQGELDRTLMRPY